MKKWIDKIEKIQKNLKKDHIDGWLLYEFQHINPLAREFLHISSQEFLTRRLFYWIPVEGEPVKIVHQIEALCLDHLLGTKKIYITWPRLHHHLKNILKDAKTIAMEYSPFQEIPTVSFVDGGLIDLIRSFGVQVVSSASFLQTSIATWSNTQYELHKKAAQVLLETSALIWERISTYLKKGKTVCEYEVQQWILKEFEKKGCETEGRPICAVNAHAANPHYFPKREKSAYIKKGDLILIDLWCKKKCQAAVFADITRVAVASKSPTQKQNEVFRVVQKAQKQGIDWLRSHLLAKKEIKGFELDDQVREVVDKAGFGAFFTHRTGHNIGYQNHGLGANIDGFETKDQRLLIPKTAFSIEPGIYLPNEWGIRLEDNIFLHDEKSFEVTTGCQEEFITLL